MVDGDFDPAPVRLRALGVMRTRRGIVAAGRRHLIDRGYHRLSLEEVAADAGVTRMTIYRRFGSKLGLLEAIADDVAERSEVVARVEAAAAAADPSAAFRALISELCRFWATDPDLFRRLVNLSAVDPQAQHLIDEREQWRYDQVSGFVHRMATADRVRPPFDADSSAIVIGAMTSFPTCDEMASRLQVPLDELDRLLLILLSGMVNLDLTRAGRTTARPPGVAPGAKSRKGRKVGTRVERTDHDPYRCPGRRPRRAGRARARTCTPARGWWL
jgi:AcrR family transcriptional regulator